MEGCSPLTEEQARKRVQTLFLENRKAVCKIYSELLGHKECIPHTCKSRVQSLMPATQKEEGEQAGPRNQRNHLHRLCSGFGLG